MNRTIRRALAVFALVAAATSSGPARAFCIWGFGNCEPANPIVGEYTLDRNPATTLTVTPAKITSRTGPISVSANYTIKSIDGKSVAIEIGHPQPRETIQVEVEKDVIKIGNSRLFAGDWRKKTAGR